MKYSLYVGMANLIALPLAISHSKTYDDFTNETKTTLVIHILFFIIGMDFIREN